MESTTGEFDVFLQYWDNIIRVDLAARMGKHDRKWNRLSELVRNNGQEGFRHGNLCSEFTRTLQIRLLSSDPGIKVTADDPDYKAKAENAAIISQSVSRVAGLRDQLFEACICGTYAGTGWLEVGHPMDPWCLDVMRSNNSPGLHPSSSVSESGIGLDEYEPLTDLGGIDHQTVQPFNPFESVPSAEEVSEPEPLFDASFGYPYLGFVDPRLVVTQLNKKEARDCDYFCRLRWLTKKELSKLTGYVHPKNGSVRNEWRDLYRQTEGEDANRYPDMMLIAQLYIVRDRNNPEYNGWTFCFPLGDPSHIIYKGPNKDGGMIPLIQVKLNRIKKMYDTPLAEELSKYADMFDKGVKAMFRDINRMLNRKWKQTNSAGLDEVEAKKAENDDYSGRIKMNDASALSPLDEAKLDPSLFSGLAWLKGQAQSTTGTSELDRGQAVKDITARQTQALLEATGINVEGMKDQVQDAAREAVMKLMHLIGLYNHLGQDRKYQFGNKFTTMDRGTHDFTQSMIYDVTVQDEKILITNEERTVWNQFLKVASATPELKPFLNWENMAEASVRRYGEGRDMLATHTPARPPLDASAIAGMEPPVSGNVLPFGGQVASDAINGQHPERENGARGVSMANALSGMSRVGT